MKNRLFIKIKKITAVFAITAMVFGTSLVVCAAGGDNNPPPADAVSGGLVTSSVYGDVLISKRANGITDYTFFDEGRPAVQQILASMEAGENIDYTKLIQSTATNIQRIYTYRGDYIKNDLKYTTGSTVENRGNYYNGAQYGSGLSSRQLTELQAWVSSVLINNNTSQMSDLQKVRTAHDYLVAHCAPAHNDNTNNRGNAYGSIVYHEANARGYARGMKALLDAMGVGCYVVNATSSSALTNYSWNVVHIGEYWYIVDTFADDSTNSKACYLISDATYNRLGMRWDKNLAPAARYDYK